MKKIKAFLLTSTAFITFSLVSCGGGGNNQQKDTATYTVMIYMCASTLESDAVTLEEEAHYSPTYGLATIDLDEMASVNIPDNIKIIVRTGGTSKWGTYAKQKYGIRNDLIQTFRIRNHSLEEDTSQRKSYSDSSTSMSTGTDLEEFLNYGKSKYSSSKNALILWNHGGGMQGVCVDTKRSDKATDFLTNSEVNTALTNSFGTTKLEWIGYDACLMAVQDVADFNSNHANYMICSQETEPGYGWAYDQWLPTLCSTPSMSTQTLLKKIADTYIADTESIGGITHNATMSVLDLSKAGTYRTNWETAATQISPSITSNAQFNTFAGFFKDGLKFGATSQDNNETVYPFDVFDVACFVDKIKDDYPAFSNITTNNYVIYNTYGSYYKNQTYKPSGLSMFCPVSKLAPKSYYEPSETIYNSWQAMCYSYGNWYTA